MGGLEAARPDVPASARAISSAAAIRSARVPSMRGDRPRRTAATHEAVRLRSVFPRHDANGLRPASVAHPPKPQQPRTGFARKQRLAHGERAKPGRGAPITTTPSRACSAIPAEKSAVCVSGFPPMEHGSSRQHWQARTRIDAPGRCATYRTNLRHFPVAFSGLGISR